MPLIRPFMQHVQPVGAVADFITVFRQAGRRRWWVMLFAGCTTFGLFAMMAQDEYRRPPRAPDITYITSWAPGRSDAEITASNIANQKRKDRLAALQAQRDALGRSMYKAIGRASGLDVDKMDRDGRADAAEADRAAKARQAELYGAGHAASSAAQ